MLHHVVDAVGDRSLAHTKFVINTSSAHDILHTYVAHLCRWLNVDREHQARELRRVSVDFMIFDGFQCHHLCKIRRVGRLLAVSVDSTWSVLAPEHNRSLLRK